MSKVAIQGNISGTGTLTIASPNTNTDRTLNLPDSAGTIATAESTLEQFNVTGSAPVFACRAFVNFNGTGTVAINASGNVSSITDLQIGQYIVNFTTAMPDANYAVAGAGPETSEVVSLRSYISFPPETTSARITLRISTTAAAVDRNGISFMIFR